MVYRNAMTPVGKGNILAFSAFCHFFRSQEIKQACELYMKFVENQNGLFVLKLSIASWDTIHCLSRKSPFRSFASLGLLSIKLLILPDTPPPGNQTKDDSKTTSGNENSTTCLVSRCLVCQEEIGREPMAHAADTIGDSNKGGPFRPWAGHDCRLPRDLQIESHKWATAEQNHGEVTSTSVQGADHENSPGQRHCDARNDVPTVLEQPTAGPRDADCDQVRNGVGWSLDQVRSHFREAESLDDLGSVSAVAFSVLA